MYEIYITKAYVLRSYVSRESDVRVLLFTKEFGLIWANASGAKKDVSKFRNFLQNMTELEAYIVEGKAGYRITGGKFIENFYFSLKENSNKVDLLEKNIFRKKVVVVQNIFSLINKVFLHNEYDYDIFDLLENFLNSLKKISDEETLKEKEILFLSKLFFLWGYFDENELIEKIGEESVELKFQEKEIDNLREKINKNISKVAF